MSLLPAAVQLMFRLEAVEAAAAAALCVPAPAAAAEPPPGDVEKGGKGAVNGDDGSGGGTAAAVPLATPSLKQRAQPFVANATTLLAMMSSAAAWMWIAKAVATACRGLPAALSSRAGLRSGQRTPPSRRAAPATCTAGPCCVYCRPPGPQPAVPAAPPLHLCVCSPGQAGAPVCDQVVAGQQPRNDGLPALHLEGKRCLGDASSMGRAAALAGQLGWSGTRYAAQTAPERGARLRRSWASPLQPPASASSGPRRFNRLPAPAATPPTAAQGPSKETLMGQMDQFLNWLPMYFTMAACLLMQPNVSRGCCLVWCTRLERPLMGASRSSAVLPSRPPCLPACLSAYAAHAPRCPRPLRRWRELPTSLCSARWAS